MAAQERLHPDDRRLWMLRHYYTALNEQPEFREALASLADEWGALSSVEARS